MRRRLRETNRGKGGGEEESRATTSSSAERVHGNDGIKMDVIRYGVVANIIASHAIARGSIPRVGISM